MLVESQSGLLVFVSIKLECPFQVWSLRQHGVTLHIRLQSERTQVQEAPAVYLVEPTSENIDRILKDLSAGLYRRFFINFSTSVPRPLLQKFATACAQNVCCFYSIILPSSSLQNTAQFIGQVVDRFVQFVSVSPSEFSLDLDKTFQILHSTDDDEVTIQQ